MRKENRAASAHGFVLLAFYLQYVFPSHACRTVSLYLDIQRATWLSLKVELKVQASMHMPLVRIPQRPAVCWGAGEGIAEGRKRVPSMWVWVYEVFSTETIISRFSALGIDIFLLYMAFCRQCHDFVRPRYHFFFWIKRNACTSRVDAHSHAYGSIPVTFSRPTP